MKRVTDLPTYSLLPQHPDNVILLQLTDPHLFADATGSLLGINTLDSYHAVLDAVKASNNRFDAIVATGDISQDHSAHSYQRFAQGLSSWSVPCFWLPGNHDHQPNMHNIHPSSTIQPHQEILIGDHWLVILLDSQVPSSPYGFLNQDQLDRLAQTLQKYPDRHVLISLHHHPILIGSRWLDQHCLKNSDALWDVVSHYSNVRSMLFGHIHQTVDCYHQDIRLLATPSTCIQFKPSSDDFSLDSLNPGWRYLELTPTGEIYTQVHRLDGNEFLPELDSTGY